jgi:hypothetical protein
MDIESSWSDFDQDLVRFMITLDERAGPDLLSGLGNVDYLDSIDISANNGDVACYSALREVLIIC